MLTLEGHGPPMTARDEREDAMAVQRKVIDSEALSSRRWELFRAAAPLLAARGFRMTTVSELAWACSMSPSSLYYYFPSKAALALFPISDQSGLCDVWHGRAETDAAPLLRLNALVDLIEERAEAFRLAFSLAREMAGDPSVAEVVGRSVLSARLDFRRIAQELAPGIADARADDLIYALMTVLASDAPWLARDLAGLRRQVIDAARGWLTGVGADATVVDQPPAAPVVTEARTIPGS
jgi:AcrR family transcriptional regulator